MLTDFARDHAFTIAWFGLMALVWFGWGQEDPPTRWRWRLGVGSALGLVLLGVFGAAVGLRWSEGSALEGRYHWFGLLVLVELLAAGIGCAVLWRRERRRWTAWWVALVVALHFVPLAFLLDDWSLVVLGLVQFGTLLALLPRLRRDDATTSRLVGPVMGVTLLGFALVSVVVFLAKTGAPW
ncbi:hypothetical protein F8O01_14295 [Pseudoclavibacter chungangensis]|uniref:Uncharacterized protein n=1 Tax=Pseudoclavibacter chungangensis TaxID=587635 RepID=A0A7J5BR51_9MICO|nr:hypothetical protein [Pseudoclavibacter chungangensis]KAB1654080.1 hypothetical protein F8O01_14295 [Pseudoclavibacter chungangensis]NYJ66007.1 ABC-type Na+ efflux pump permease subunit [Pseudoclavibacter chungangensis]